MLLGHSWACSGFGLRVQKGSPDPDGRQIDGLGGGLSSLSKVAVVGKPGEPKQTMHLSENKHLHSSQHDWAAADGVTWLDDVRKARTPGVGGWDVVYRFAQVGVREPIVDWGTTCGNLIAGVAHVRYCVLFTSLS